ncbi:MAG: ATPase, T2SS/T4P/T4SS family [Coprobacillus cateniformis]
MTMFPRQEHFTRRQVILVGEMRDLETIDIAVTAAETRHLVFSSLHTVGAANTIDRMIDVFPPSQDKFEFNGNGT